MLLGLVPQWAMSILIAAIYSFAASMWPVLARRWVLWGTLYGVVVFIVMNYVVVPLSAVHRIPHFTARMFAENMLAMLLFGLIVAYFARNARGAVQSQKASVPAA
jgi:uncharacterized membrane protein YagU involved in acid resistance